MLNKMNISSQRQKLIVYIALTVVTFAVFWQVNQFDFVYDDIAYVTQNSHIQCGITQDGLRWAFSTTYAEFWHPMTWLSLMFDYQLYGMNAGGYHITNVILHILSTLLLFRLFNRMTGAIWKSAFVAAFFALHPLRVESVAWIAERKDVLSVFWGILTLYLYVYYTEKPAIKRYLLVIFSFICALMSKSMVVTLPVLMILLDYWPLGRLQQGKIAENPMPIEQVPVKNKKQKTCKTELKGNASPAYKLKLPETKIAGIIPLWQLWEKTSFFVLAAVFSVVAIYAQRPMFTDEHSVAARLANAPVSVVRYLGNTLWPHDLAMFYPFSDNLPLWLIWGSSLLIIIISIFVMESWKRLPYLFVGWLWYLITLMPVIGIIRSTSHSMHDCYTYLPSVGPAVMLAWGVPLLFANQESHRKIIFPAAIAVLAVLSVITWHQCGYWKNDITIFSHTVQVTKNNSMFLNNLGTALFYQGKFLESLDQYNEAIRIAPHDFDAFLNRGFVYAKLRQYQNAIEDFSKAINLKPPRDTEVCYNSRGDAYLKTGQYQLATDDFNKAISLNPDYTGAYINRAIAYLNWGNKKLGCYDAYKACELGYCNILEMAKGKGDCR